MVRRGYTGKDAHRQQMKLFIYDDKIPTPVILVLLLLLSAGCIWTAQRANRTGALTTAHEEALKREALETQLELKRVENRLKVAEANAKVPDHYSVKVHEWLCSNGSLVVPSRTLGNPTLSHILPDNDPRPLTDVEGAMVAYLNPDGTIDYDNAVALGCPPELGSFVLFGEPQDGVEHHTPQFTTR